MISRTVLLTSQGASGLLPSTLTLLQRKGFSCDTCHFKVFSKRELNLHLSRENACKFQSEKLINKKECPVCKATFSKQQGMKIHYRSVHEGETFNCDECSKSFTRKNSLDVHKKAVHEKIRYECHICHQQFSQQGHRTTHIKKAHEEVRYYCQICNYNFKDKSYLKLHITKFHKN